MKYEIKIGIVNDDPLLTQKIINTLTKLGYSLFVQVTGYDAALQMLKIERPEIVLLNTELVEKQYSKDIAKKLCEQFHQPFIFFTTTWCSGIEEHFKNSKNVTCLNKKFSSEELNSALQAAINNYSDLSIFKLPGIHKDFIFMKEHHRYIKILFIKIAYIECRENYVIIHYCDKKNAILRSTFTDILLQLPAGIFYRVHRSFAIQIDLIDSIENHDVIVSGMKVPVSITYRDGLFTLLGIPLF